MTKPVIATVCPPRRYWSADTSTGRTTPLIMRSDTLHRHRLRMSFAHCDLGTYTFNQEITYSPDYVERMAFHLECDTKPNSPSCQELRRKQGTKISGPFGRFDAKARFTIAHLGDSFASGEGNPDQCGRAEDPRSEGFFDLPVIKHIRRAFEGAVDALPLDGNVGVDDLFVPVVATKAVANAILNNVEPCRVSRDSFVIEPAWLEPRAHRARRSAAALLTPRLEEWLPGVAVTALSFASSGAKIEHLFTDKQHGWQAGHQTFELRRALTTPASALASIPSCRLPRRLDALVISIGGNNVNFSKALRTLALNAAGDRVTLDAKFAQTLVRETFDKEINLLLGPRGREGTEGKFAELSRLLRSPQFGVDIGKIYLVEYPEALFSVAPGQDGEGCGALFGPAISASDARQIRNLGRALNDRLRRFTQSPQQRDKWVFVDGVAAAFDGHGYCAKQSYFVRYGESCACQGDIMGTMHPNRAGQEVIMQKVLAAIERTQGPEVRAAIRLFERTLIPTDISVAPNAPTVFAPIGPAPGTGAPTATSPPRPVVAPTAPSATINIQGKGPLVTTDRPRSVVAPPPTAIAPPRAAAPPAAAAPLAPAGAGDTNATGRPPMTIETPGTGKP